ncbi:MAG: chemotaxis protein CheD [Alphaproteobacteria bacterium]|nr:chemotaxis protein CheD [Alphaproteobacteria bacterium]
MSDDFGVSGPSEDVVQYQDGHCRRVLSVEEAFDRKFEQDRVFVLPGRACWLEGDGEVLVSVVGVGIVLSIYDEQLKFGVLAHCVLSRLVLDAFPALVGVDDAEIQKVVAPIEAAIAEMKKHGAGRNRIRTRLFGGAVLAGGGAEDGLKGLIFVKEYLHRKGVKVMSEDVGGNALRRIYFVPSSGVATRFALRRKEDFDELVRRESEYFIDINN